MNARLAKEPLRLLIAESEVKLAVELVTGKDNDQPS